MIAETERHRAKLRHPTLMTSPPEAETDPLAGALGELQSRFDRISRDESRLSAGYRTICAGVGQLVDELRADTDADPVRLELLSHGLARLADLLEGYQPLEAAKADPAAPEVADPAAQFREMFRQEARRRLSGLSISLMGIFDERAASDALAQTGAHLHAIRGAAAMVGLSELGGLIGAMEQVIQEMKAQQPDERTWPTRALLRGFHLLEAAVAHEDLAVDAGKSSATIRALRTYLSPPSAEKPHAGAPAEPKRESHAAPTRAAKNAPETTPQTQTQTRRAEPSRGELPAHKSARDTVVGGQKTPGRPAYAGPLEKRILIVDDIETIAASVGFVLSELEVPIDMAAHGAEALEMLRARPYSLVVSDVDMPRMDGMTLTRMIRSDPAMSEIPVILLTSLDRPDERDAGIEAGATDYVIKGAIGGGELLNRVKELLAMAPDVPAGDHPERAEQLRVLIAEDVETIAASIAFVLSEGPFDIDIARNGALALSRLRQERYDLLLSDVEMPEMGGLELLEAVRADDRLLDLPVILLTSLQDPEVQQLALNVGADRFLIKGEVGGDKLRQILEEVAAARAERARMGIIEVDPSETTYPTETPSQ